MDKKWMEMRWKKLVAKAWADPDWKQRLLADPVGVFREEGIEWPEGLQLRLLEELPGTKTVVLPQPPEGAWDMESQEARIAAWECWF